MSLKKRKLKKNCQERLKCSPLQLKDDLGAIHGFADPINSFDSWYPFETRENPLNEYTIM